jgi:type I restriction enzyme M protein
VAKKDKVEASITKKLFSLEYEFDWKNYTDNEEINKILSKASKAGTGKPGFPDHLYVNEEEKLFIMIEDKNIVGDHISEDGESEPIKYAVDGIKWYLKHFINIELETTKDYFKHWKIIGLAISGDLADDYNHRLSTFIVIDDKIHEQKQITNIKNEKDYINLFFNFNEEDMIKKISSSSKSINKWLRSVDSQKRPILLSALMICLFKIKGGGNSFINEYPGNTPAEIVKKIQDRVDTVLKSENIKQEKRDVLKAELEFIHHDSDLNSISILKDILNELQHNIIPLFSRRSNYDIIGRFYEEFLRFAGVANVKKGIVLTPSHISSLFVLLLQDNFKYNDIIMDPACGTGSFLISAMNKLVELIEKSKMPNKDELLLRVKKNQLIGFEKNSTMYSLAIANMLFRGDGKSQIFNLDYFSKEADDELEKLEKIGIKPTIGFINPPYGGKGTKDNPTPKEITFLTRMLDQVSRYGIMIAPLSTYFKDESTRNSILEKHTLKYVINMPNDLFLPNAATHTAISVFETHKPQGNQETIFFDLRDDGFVLSKQRGRTDTYNKWDVIKNDMFEKINNPYKYVDKLTLVKTNIRKNDEWVIQAHSETDYSNLNENSFINSIKSYMVFNAKKEMNILNEEIDEFRLLELLNEYYFADDGEEEK